MKIGFASMPLTGHRNFQRVIAQTQGLDLAADVIERALGEPQPAEQPPALSTV